jgi:polar amino acid transport system substrate-binding protein
VALPSSIGVRREPDTRFREVVNAWIDMNRGTGQIREWMIQGILKSGAKPEDIPPELTF